MAYTCTKHWCIVTDTIIYNEKIYSDSYCWTLRTVRQSSVATYSTWVNEWMNEWTTEWIHHSRALGVVMWLVTDVDASLSRALRDVVSACIPSSSSSFDARWAMVVTWHNVTFHGATSSPPPVSQSAVYITRTKLNRNPTRFSRLPWGSDFNRISIPYPQKNPHNHGSSEVSTYTRTECSNENNPFDFWT